VNRHVLFLDLQDDPDLIAAYEAHHAPGAVPAHILDSIRSAGIETMEIYRTGNRLVMIMETSEAFDATAKAEVDRCDPEVRAWETLMNRFQRPLPGPPTARSGLPPGQSSNCRTAPALAEAIDRVALAFCDTRLP
jgi:L-rhamnose mutarotase